MLYFYNEKTNALFETVDIEDKKHLDKYLKNMKAEGFINLLEEEYIKVSEKLMEDMRKESEHLNSGYITERKQAIADAKKVGWSDAMINQLFGKAE
jgi:DNA-binding transcriptional regulator YhcF (GntR family)